MLNLGPTLGPEARFLDGLPEKMEALNDARIPWGLSFLDDCLGGVYPDDLIVIGAGTGVGKTELAFQTALAGVDSGLDPVVLYALEAEFGEVSSRLAFKELAKRVKNKRMDFAGWWRGAWKQETREHWDEVQAALEPRLSKLHTLYKSGEFGNAELVKQLEGVANTAKMVVLDHVHVIDHDDRRELAGQTKTMRILRDFALVSHIPVVAISHVRKKSQYERNRIMPTRDDLHGSSNLSKPATGIIMVARDWQGGRPEPHLSPTFIKVDKDRRGRETPFVARMYYDMSAGVYLPDYRLGTIQWRDRQLQWEPVPPRKLPYWAVREVSRKKEMPF